MTDAPAGTLSRRLATIGLALIVAWAPGCDRQPPSPTQPTPPDVRVPAPPVPTPSGPAPTVTGLSPDSGSTEGSYFKITGTGFASPRVTLAGVTVTPAFSPDPTTIHVTVPPHAAGRVDVVVINGDGQTATAPGGFTYAPPDSFEVDGQWEGGADSNYETPLRLTIIHHAVTRISCGLSTVIFPVQLPITGGAFSTIVGQDGSRIGGRILNPTYALGTISLPACVNYPWFAAKQP
jgi:hypothetical protein